MIVSMVVWARLAMILHAQAILTVVVHLAVRSGRMGFAAMYCYGSRSTVTRTPRCHRTEEVSACIATCDGAWSVVVVAVDAIAVVVVDGEVPATVDEHDGAMEVGVADETVPDGVAQQVAESCITSGAHSQIVIVVVTQCHIVEVVVHTPDVVVVDAIDLVDEKGVADAQRVCHTVSQEPSVALHGQNAHALSVHRHGSSEEDDSGEESS